MCLIHFVNPSARSADPTSHLVWFRSCGAQIRNAKPDRAVIDCCDEVPCGNEDVDERYFVCGMRFCFLFLTVDNADTCAGRCCAVESDSRSDASFRESYHTVCPRSSVFVDLLVLTMTGLDQRRK